MSTMVVELHAAHVYQRRFDSADLASAVEDCHLYMISRRPSVRVIADSVRMYPAVVEFAAVVSDGATTQVEAFALPLDPVARASDFRLHDQGAYFSFRTGGQMWHGDAWSLAALSRRAQGAIAEQEVLYIGKAFGPFGKHNAWQRTRRHEKLQRIYEEHVGGPDIFVTPLRIHQASQLDPAYIGGGLHTARMPGGYHGVFRDKHGGISSSIIDLLEHALIAYFVPYYNEKLTEWRPDQPTKAMLRTAASGFGLLKVHLNGAGGIARFYSLRAATRTRSHLITRVLTAEGRRVGRWGASTRSSVPLSSSDMPLEPDQAESVMSAGESAEAALRVFGTRAPRVRRPPYVEVEDDIYERMDRYRSEQARFPKVIPYDGRPLFDERTGTVRLGIDTDNQPLGCRVFDDRARPLHGMLLGPAGSGLTNCLCVLTLGIIQARPTLLWAADTQARHLSMMRRLARTRLVDWAAMDLHELERILCAATAIAETRGPSQIRGNGSDETDPNILVTIEDAHHAFARPVLRRLAERLALAGPAAGISIVITLPDENIARFGDSERLRALFVAGNVLCLGEEDALLTLEAVRDASR